MQKDKNIVHNNSIKKVQKVLKQKTKIKLLCVTIHGS
jgi:hypothetical protein